MDETKNQKVDEILAAFDKKDWTLAVNISGEALAEADGEYAKLKNRGQNTDMELEYFGLMAGFHCMSLLYASEVKMLLNTSLVCMYQIENDGYKDIDIDESLMVISATALAAHTVFCLSTEQFEPDDEVKEHCLTMGRYIASYCYYLYNKVNKELPDSTFTEFVYPILNDAMNLFKIDTPTIEVCGKQINPAEDRMEIMADLLGRARALGFFDEPQNHFDEEESLLG